MNSILAPRYRRHLARCVQGDTLLAFDFDGTLAPIVRNPEQAALRPPTRRWLRSLCGSVPCVVITGRARGDAIRRLSGVPLADVIGNHGMEEPGVDGTAWRRRVRAWIPALAEALGPLTGVVLEDKRDSLAVHYRNSPRPTAARAAILRAVAGLAGANTVGGKRVVNVIPAGAPDKGDALAAACARRGLARALYVGDDENDEAVFARPAPPRILGIRVGRSARSRARWYLRQPADVDRLLQQLVELAREHRAGTLR